MDRAPVLEKSTLSERPVASYRDDELILTEHRVVYQGKDRAGHEVRLEDVAHAALQRKVAFHPYRFVFMILLFFLAFVSTRQLWLLALFSFALPLSWTDQTHICFTTQGGVMRIPVPRGYKAEATSFVQAVHHALRSQETDDSRAVPGPTTTPFGR